MILLFTGFYFLLDFDFCFFSFNLTTIPFGLVAYCGDAVASFVRIVAL